jgi:hypothetical protein
MAIQDPWRGLLSQPVARDHFVQVYRDERVLIEAISLFAGAALGRNEAVVLVATPSHGAAVEEALRTDGFEVEALKAWGQLNILDASEVLSRFMVDSAPDEALFKGVIKDLIGSIRESRRFKDVRVYGEMVNILWTDNLPAAQRLEALWNDVIAEHEISLFCAYCLDGAGKPDRVFPRDLQALHTHFIPTERPGASA